jgi:predicted NAD-dependent protein-ADP-ribosyltransferase YbiA (DUF1768 family)
MSKSIKIFDPKERVYGKLSNNYKYWMEISPPGSGYIKFDYYRDRYPTVTNFIYSNLLLTPNMRAQLKTVDVSKIKEMYDQLLVKEQYQIIQKSVEEAYSAKVNQNEELQEKLLTSGNSPFVYISNDVFLGVGPDGTGYNLVGKYLEQIRRQLLLSTNQKEKQKVKQERDFALYEAYLAEKALIKAIINDGNDLTDFIGKTPGEIINIIGRPKIMLSAASQDIVVEQFAKQGILTSDVFLAIDDPTILTHAIRKKYLSNLPGIIDSKRHRIVFEMYAEYLLEKKYPQIKEKDRAYAVQQQIDLSSDQSLAETERRLYILFTDGMLSERLSDNIDRRLERLRKPTKEEITEAEIFDINPREKGPTINVPYLAAEGNPVRITVNPTTEEERIFSVFSTIDNSVMININGRKYPTIIHFNLASRIAAIPSIKTIKKAYSFLLEDPNVTVEGISSFYHYQTVFNEYNKLNMIDTQERLISLMETALNKKFQNREFQDVLLTTKNTPLIWNDYSAPILGAGKDGKGDNLVGKYLMKIRIQLKEERKDEKIEKLSLEDITNVLEKDPFLQKWLQMRVNDMCRTIILMKQYLQEKTPLIEVELTAKLTSSVLNDIYHPCSHFFATISQVKIPTPVFFINMIRKVPGFQKTSKDVIQEIWLRIAVIFYYLIEYLKEVSVYDIRKILNGVEQMVTKSNKCVKITNKTVDNCTISALINLMTGISTFNKTMGEDSTLTKTEVGVATSIILNKDVSDQLDPKLVAAKSVKIDEDKGELNDLTIEDILKSQKKPPKKQYVSATGYPQYDDTPFLGKDIIDRDEEDLDIDLLKDDPEDYGNEEEEFDEGAEEDYGEIGDFEEEFADEYSPRQNLNLLRFLQNLEEYGYKIDDPEGIVFYIEGAVDLIKTYSKMSKQVKNNRINFFATQS